MHGMILPDITRQLVGCKLIIKCVSGVALFKACSRPWFPW